MSPLSLSRRTAVTSLTTGAVFAALASQAEAHAVSDEPSRIFNVVKELGKINDASLIIVHPNSSRPHWKYSPTKGPKVQGSNKAGEIQKLIDTISETGGGTLYFPQGGYRVDGLVLPSNVNIEGQNAMTTTLYLNDGANKSVISNKLSDGTNPNAFGMKIANITVNGNRWGQTLNWYDKKPYQLDNPHEKMSHGILLHKLYTELKLDGAIDSYTRVYNVKATNCFGTGIFAKEHGGEVRIFGCDSLRNGGHGFVTGWDQKVSFCTAGQNEYSGYEIKHGSTIISDCKAFMSGYRCADRLLDGIWYSTYPCAGFNISDAVGHLILTSPNAQNNTAEGIRIHNTKSVIVSGALVDCNNMCAQGDADGWYTVGIGYRSDKEQTADEKTKGIDRELRRTKPWTYSGVCISGNSSYNQVSMISWTSHHQSGTPFGHQRHALSLRDKVHNNRIEVTHTTLVKERPEGAIINPEQTPADRLKENYVIDGKGNVLASAVTQSTGDPQKVVDLENRIKALETVLKTQTDKVSALEAKSGKVTLPVLTATGRSQKHDNGAMAIDSRTLRVMTYQASRNRWVFVHDNSVVR